MVILILFNDLQDLLVFCLLRSSRQKTRLAEGCFLVRVSKNSDYKSGSGYQVLLNFRLTQHIRDKLLIESFISYFKCGKYSNSSGRDWGYFSVVKYSDIETKIIPFFKEFKIEGVKAKDF